MPPEDEHHENGFDFDAFVREARIGYANLSEHRTNLLAEQQRIELELKRVTMDSERLAAMLKSAGVEPQESLARGRQMNVAPVTHQVVEQVFKDASVLSVNETRIIDAVLAIEPLTRPRSVQSVLYRMSQSGKLVRSGNRGAYTYSRPEFVNLID